MKATLNLHPSVNYLAEHHGKLIVWKPNRKKWSLFLFPDLVKPVGGKIGDMRDYDTENPIVYLDFSQGG